MAAVNYFLDERHTGPAPDNKPWAEHGCIIFSQYFDTAKGVVAEIAKAHFDQVVAVYAGPGKVVFSEVKNFRRLNASTSRTRSSGTKSRLWWPQTQLASANPGHAYQRRPAVEPQQT